MAKRLTMNTRKGKPFSEVFGEFITAQTAKGVSGITLRNYRQVLHNITRFFDVETPMDALSKRDIEQMVIEMRNASLAHNTISSFLSILFRILLFCLVPFFISYPSYYDDGNRDVFFCLAVNMLEVADLCSVLSQADLQTRNLSRHDKAEHIEKLLRECAAVRHIPLELRQW